MQKLNIAIPQDAVWILNKLNEGGHEAYIVGGCVRDSILGRIPQDWDITTSALPEETKTIFDHTFDTGIKHGTITVVLHHENYEVTTYRIDGEYADCRHPDEVSFTKKLNEDLLRRDFTMNAIAWSPQGGLSRPLPWAGGYCRRHHSRRGRAGKALSGGCPADAALCALFRAAWLCD